MSIFRMPLSGSVTQSILPWTWLFNPVAHQIGLVNIDLGESAAPAVEEEVLNEVASYGRQLGRIEEALVVLLDTYQPSRELSEKEGKSIAALRSMVKEIAAVKKRHGRA